VHSQPRVTASSLLRPLFPTALLSVCRRQSGRKRTLQPSWWVAKPAVQNGEADIVVGSFVPKMSFETREAPPAIGVHSPLSSWWPPARLAVGGRADST
jgi:hypothetical protein